MTNTQLKRLKRLETLNQRVQSRFSVSYMDVRRQIDGKMQQVLTDVVVRTTRQSLDNANPAAVSTKPVAMTITVHMPPETDVRNGDTIVIRHVNSAGDITDVFRGTAGDPYINDGRKHIRMTMQQLGRSVVGV